MNYATINDISLLFFYFYYFFCTCSYRGNWDLFIMTSNRSKPFAAVKKRSRKKPALNSPAKRRLKNCWKPATLLKMSFIIGIFQGLWLLRSECLFLRMCFSGCFQIFVIQKQLSGGVLYCCKIHRKTPVPEFLLEFCDIFKNTFFYRATLVAASGNSGMPSPLQKLCNVIL